MKLRIFYNSKKSDFPFEVQRLCFFGFPGFGFNYWSRRSSYSALGFAEQCVADILRERGQREKEAQQYPSGVVKTFE